MPFRIMATTMDVQSALTNQGYTTERAGRLDRLDTTVSSRAAPGAAMDLAPGGETKVRAQIDGEFTERGYTAARAGNLDRLDTTVSSRAAPGAAMDIIAAARAAIWNELIPATPAAGSYGARINSNLDVAVGSRAAPGAAMGLAAPFNTRLDTTVSSRAAPGAAMDLAPGGETKVRAQIDGEFTERGYTSARAGNLDNLNATVSSRATPADVGTQLDGRGVSTARMAKMDLIAAIATNSGSVTAANNTAGLTVSLDTGGAAGRARAVIEVRYTCGGPATLFAEGSEDNVNWFVGDEISETAAATNKLVGYLNAHRFFRFRSPTAGINLSFDINALL